MVLPHLRHSQRECQSEGSWARYSHLWEHTERLIFSGRVKINLNREVNMGATLLKIGLGIDNNTHILIIESCLNG